MLALYSSAASLIEAFFNSSIEFIQKIVDSHAIGANRDIIEEFHRMHMEHFLVFALDKFA